MPTLAPQLAPIPSAPPRSLPFYEPAPLNLGPARTPLNLGPARTPLNLGAPLPDLGRPLPNLGQPLSLPGPAGVPRVPSAPIAPASAPGIGGAARGLGNIGLAIGAAQLGWAIGDALRREALDRGLLPDDYRYPGELPREAPIAPKLNAIPPGKAAPFTGGQCVGISYRVAVTFDDYGWAGNSIYLSANNGHTGDYPGPIGPAQLVPTGQFFDLYGDMRPYYRVQFSYNGGVWQSPATWDRGRGDGRAAAGPPRG